jgi:hypothetical protein
MDARTKTGELYRGTSLKALRYGLNRYLKDPPLNKKIDIIKDTSFNNANKLFQTAMKEIKQEGKGDVKHADV